jgi:hypothetical protein
VDEFVSVCDSDNACVRLRIGAHAPTVVHTGPALPHTIHVPPPLVLFLSTSYVTGTQRPLWGKCG